MGTWGITTQISLTSFKPNKLKPDTFYNLFSTTNITRIMAAQTNAYAPARHGPQRQGMTTIVAQEEKYCGPISWLICCFTPVGCAIAMCPVDTRPMTTTIVQGAPITEDPKRV